MKCLERLRRLRFPILETVILEIDARDAEMVGGMAVEKTMPPNPNIVPKDTLMVGPKGPFYRL